MTSSVAVIGPAQGMIPMIRKLLFAVAASVTILTAFGTTAAMGVLHVAASRQAAAVSVP